MENTIKNACLGIELGSTRIKAVLIGADHAPIATGSYSWENRYEGGFWTYSLEDVWTGMREAFSSLAKDVKDRYGVALTRVGAIGVSAMMHGYLAFDADDALLVPFRTWRNTTTLEAVGVLTPLFDFSIPQRWSVAHLYQAILDGEPHVGEVRFLTTLAGYVHWKLTGRKVLGIGDASGMFPIDSQALDYDEKRLAQFDAKAAGTPLARPLRDVLPQVLVAGEDAGALTQEGAALLDGDGALEPGIPFCPPEGDAGTGMAATASVRARTGNISAGTSIFAMIVTERPLSKVYPEIDMVTTPAGAPVAMVHCNNCTSDLDAWAGVFREFAHALGAEADASKVYEVLYGKALDGDPDAGGLLLYNYLSGEHITHFEQGRPLVARSPESRFTLANFLRAHLYSSVATLRIGMDILASEKVAIDRIVGHGGLFKTGRAGQQVMADALNAPVSVMETAGEGGAWGVALLAAYRLYRSPGEALEDYLDEKAFATMARTEAAPDPSGVDGFAGFLERFRKSFPVERAAVDSI
ncbi:MAG: ATPase [Clostridiales Family XIII bacterium]|jgi:sugar (pentulose or hexulose) kinase|nr:ATPase [Clostridiales Family XIII bacterium]